MGAFCFLFFGGVVWFFAVLICRLVFCKPLFIAHVLSYTVSDFNYMHAPS